MVAAAFIFDAQRYEWFDLLPQVLMLKAGRGFIYNTWENPTQNIPLLQTFYFFNITNPKEVMEKSVTQYTHSDNHTKHAHAHLTTCFQNGTAVMI